MPIKLEGGLVGHFRNIAGLKGSFLLDSVTSDRKEGRYSFAGIDPVHTISSKGGFIELNGRTVIDNPMTALKRLIKLTRAIDTNDNYLPFMGGMVGFIGSEWGNSLGELSSSSNIPDISFGLYDTIVTYDHLEETAWVSSFGLKRDGSTDSDLAKSRAERLAEILITSDPSLLSGGSRFYPPLTGRHPVVSSLNKDLFIDGLLRLKTASSRLPLFAREFSSPTERSAWEVYLDIRAENQAAYAAYLNHGNFQVLSAARTRLIKIDNESISLKPTKGYAARSKDSEEESKRINRLKHDEEIQGSHRYMVSDVIRNLGDVCESGSLDLEDIAGIESDTRAHHLVSRISGKKIKGAMTIDCVLGVMRALTDTNDMEMIASLEMAPRNVYTGSIGFIGVNGDTEFNFAFRTMILKDTIGHLHAGTEVGRDTDPEEAFFNTNRSAEHIFKLCQTRSL